MRKKWSARLTDEKKNCLGNYMEKSFLQKKKNYSRTNRDPYLSEKQKKEVKIILSLIYIQKEKHNKKREIFRQWI